VINYLAVATDGGIDGKAGHILGRNEVALDTCHGACNGGRIIALIQDIPYVIEHFEADRGTSDHIGIRRIIEAGKDTRRHTLLQRIRVCRGEIEAGIIDSLPHETWIKDRFGVFVVGLDDEIVYGRRFVSDSIGDLLGGIFAYQENGLRRCYEIIARKGVPGIELIRNRD
jgi:hypothetical protein